MKNAIFYPPSSTLDLLISCWLLLRIASPCSTRRAENAAFRASGGRKKWADKVMVDSQTSFWRELESASTNRLKLCGQRSHCYGAVTIIRPRFSNCWMAPLDRYGTARRGGYSTPNRADHGRRRGIPAPARGRHNDVSQWLCVAPLAHNLRHERTRHNRDNCQRRRASGKPGRPRHGFDQTTRTCVGTTGDRIKSVDPAAREVGRDRIETGRQAGDRAFCGRRLKPGRPPMRSGIESVSDLRYGTGSVSDLGIDQ